MPQTCSICRNDAVTEINTALLAGASTRDVAGQFRVAKSSVDRHRRKCLAARVSAMLAKHEEVSVQTLMSILVGVRDRLALAVMTASATAKDMDVPNLARASAELREVVRLHARLAGLIDEKSPVTVDLRQQTAVLSGMSDEDLRALAAHARELGRPPAALPAGDVIDGEIVDGAPVALVAAKPHG